MRECYCGSITSRTLPQAVHQGESPTGSDVSNRLYAAAGVRNEGSANVLYLAAYNLQ